MYAVTNTSLSLSLTDLLFFLQIIDLFSATEVRFVTQLVLTNQFKPIYSFPLRFLFRFYFSFARIGIRSIVKSVIKLVFSLFSFWFVLVFFSLCYHVCPLSFYLSFFAPQPIINKYMELLAWTIWINIRIFIPIWGRLGNADTYLGICSDVSACLYLFVASGV